MKGKVYRKTSILIILLFTTIVMLGCQAPPVEEKCPTPDGSKITVSRGTITTGGMVITGAPGAVLPGATVTITDSEGDTVVTTADQDGGFTIVEADLPEDFDHSIGNELSITQKATGCTESDDVDVAIGA
ncbi:carboxypeptidase regulatory-like domain-containing protein [bacterium]|nr:carboxypeptidase regulatory-like domain-containing protein [bacterium]